MRIVVVVAAALALLAGCGEDDEGQGGAAPGLADLTVTVDWDGDAGAKPQTAQVRCESGAASAACRTLANVKRDVFEPVPGDVACTQLYGGPETATVEGTLRGEPIDAEFSRENGCEIDRWQRVSELLRAAG